MRQMRSEQKHIYFTRLARNNDIICLEETYVKDEFLQAVQVVFPQFCLCCTFTLNDVNACGSAVIIHEKPPTRRCGCQSCNHVPRTRSHCEHKIWWGASWWLSTSTSNLTWGIHAKDCASFLCIGLSTLKPLVLLCVTSIFASPRMEYSTSGMRPSQKVIRGKRLFSVLFHRISTKKDSAADGTIRTHYPGLTCVYWSPLWLRRVIFTATLHVSDYLGERSIPSDHVAMRVVSQKPTNRWPIRANSELDVETSRFLYCLKEKGLVKATDDLFAALADFKVILEKVRRTDSSWTLTQHTPGSSGTKFLIASTALRALKNRHLNTLMHCCEACEPVGNLLGPMLLRVHWLSWIEPDYCEPHARKTCWTRSRNTPPLPGRRRKKTTLWRNADSVFVLGVPRNRCSVSTQNTLLRMKASQAWDYAPTGVRFFRRVLRAKGTHHETIVGNVQKAPDDLQCKLTGVSLRRWLPQRNPLQVPMGFRTTSRDKREHWALNAYKHVLEGGATSTHFAASRDRFHSQVVLW